MSKWTNSAELTRTSYTLVQAHPEMKKWTVRAAVHAAVIGVIGTIAGLALVGLGAESSGATGLVVLVGGVVVIVLAMLAAMTAANRQMAALVHATDAVLHGRDPSEDAARAAASAEMRTLFEWSAISAGVGALVSFIGGDGKGGFLTTIVRSLLAGLVASVWAIVTTLVLPVVVLERLGAVAAVKRSAGLIRSTWGEAVFGSVRIGARFGLVFTLPGMLLLAGGIALTIALDGVARAAGGGLAVVGLALILVGAVRAATCRNVFGVALYRWATGEGALGPFSEEDLRGAVSTRDSQVTGSTTQVPEAA